MSLTLEKDYIVNITCKDISEAMKDARCRHFIMLAAAKRLNLPLEQLTSGAFNLKGDKVYNQSSEVGSGRQLKNPSFKLNKFERIIHHEYINDKKIHVYQHLTK